MTLGSSNIYWEESIHTEGKSDRKQEDLPTLQHQQVVNWVSECELRSQNMKKLLAAMSSFEVSVKSVESTIYSTSLIFTRASWLEWWKWLQTLVKQARKRPLLWWRYFLLVGVRPAVSNCAGEGCRSVSDWQCNTGKAQLAEPKLTLMILWLYCSLRERIYSTFYDWQG